MAQLTHDHEHVHDVGRMEGTGTSAVSNIVRMILTIAGAAGMIVGAFLEWVNGRDAVGLTYRAYYRPIFTGSSFLVSAGAVMILLGLIALIGLAGWGGWLSRFAGALGVIAFVLIAISMNRATGMTLPDDIGAGLWWSLAGSIVVLIGGFLSTPWG
jgi:hypothetical protein